MKHKIDAAYAPLSWPADSKLSPEERAHVERQRRALWDRGIRREPQLTRMAFEFGAVASMCAADRQALADKERELREGGIGR